MDSYSKFVNDGISKGKLFIETDDGEYSEDWKLIINLNKLWKEYSSQQKTLLDFNNEYATALIENSETIANTCGEQCWGELEPVVINELRGSTNEDESETIYNKLYDIFDKYEILIKTDNVENEAPDIV
jgi:hypothetical protein